MIKISTIPRIYIQTLKGTGGAPLDIVDRYIHLSSHIRVDLDFNRIKLQVLLN